MSTSTLATQMMKSIRYIKPVWSLADTELLGRVYQQLQTDFMPGPVLTLHSPAPQIMAGVWSLLRETLMAGSTDRVYKEVVAATVSKINACPFCIDAHTTMLHATGNHDVVKAVLHDDAHIRNPQLAAFVQWTWANQKAATISLARPFSAQDAPEILGTVFTFNYINRMANVFLGDTFLPLPAALKGVTRHLLGVTLGKRMVRRLPAGNALQFVPPANLPEDLAWAQTNPTVAHALAGFTRLMTEAGQSALSEQVRTLAQGQIDHWQGETMGISRRWVEDAVVGLAAPDCAAARLVLLTALASYQVDSSIIADFRAHYPTDQQLIEATAWASFSAARRANTWFAQSLLTKEEQA